MTRDELDGIVREELQHLPRIDDGSDQNGLRMMYNMIRRRELGRNPGTSKVESLRLAIRAVRQSNPRFTPHYDVRYFAG